MIGLKKSVSAAVLVLLWLAACGGGSSSLAPDQASSSLILTLSNAGVSPKASAVSQDSSITVLNSDSVPHQLVTRFLGTITVTASDSGPSGDGNGGG